MKIYVVFRYDWEYQECIACCSNTKNAFEVIAWHKKNKNFLDKDYYILEMTLDNLKEPSMYIDSDGVVSKHTEPPY